MTVISTNPATGVERTLELDDTPRDEVLAIARLAKDNAVDFAERSLAWRSDLLRAMADELEGDVEHLVVAAMDETALPEARLRGELARTSFQMRFFAEVVLDGSFLAASIDEAMASPMGPLPDLRRVRTPVGPVAIFGSSNFPFAFSVPGGDTASALAAGCPVLIKAHPAHPATSAATFAALARAARRLDAPAHTLSIVFGFEAGAALVDAPDVAAVGFTGSLSAGRALWARANARDTPIAFYGELGSANPLVVTTAAARERAAQIGTDAAGSVILGAGQFCTKPGLLFVPAGESGDTLVHELVRALSTANEFTMLSAGIADNFRRSALAFEREGRVAVLVGREWGDEARTSARLYEVDAMQFVTESTLHTECFGPTAIVVRYDSSAQLRTALLAAEPALTFTLHAADEDPDARWLLDLGAQRAGRVLMNGFPTGVGVSWSMHHGGPWPSTTAPWATSVGAAAIERWLRPVTFQSVPEALLPPALQSANPLSIPRRVNGHLEVPH